MAYTENFTLFPTIELVTNRGVIHVGLPSIRAKRNGFQLAGNTEREMCGSQP